MPYLFCFEEQCFAHEVGNMAKMNDLQLIIAVLINCIDPFPALGRVSATQDFALWASPLYWEMITLGGINQVGLRFPPAHGQS